MLPSLLLLVFLLLLLLTSVVGFGESGPLQAHANVRPVSAPAIAVYTAAATADQRPGRAKRECAKPSRDDYDIDTDVGFFLIVSFLFCFFHAVQPFAADELFPHGA